MKSIFHYLLICSLLLVIGCETESNEPSDPPPNIQKYALNCQFDPNDCIFDLGLKSFYWINSNYNESMPVVGISDDRLSISGNGINIKYNVERTNNCNEIILRSTNADSERIRNVRFEVSDSIILMYDDLLCPPSGCFLVSRGLNKENQYYIENYLNYTNSINDWDCEQFSFSINNDNSFFCDCSFNTCGRKCLNNVQSYEINDALDFISVERLKDKIYILFRNKQNETILEIFDDKKNMLNKVILSKKENRAYNIDGKSNSIIDVGDGVLIGFADEKNNTENNLNVVKLSYDGIILKETNIPSSYEVSNDLSVHRLSDNNILFIDHTQRFNSFDGYVLNSSGNFLFRKSIDFGNRNVIKHSANVINNELSIFISNSHTTLQVLTYDNSLNLKNTKNIISENTNENLTLSSISSLKIKVLNDEVYILGKNAVNGFTNGNLILIYNKFLELESIVRLNVFDYDYDQYQILKDGDNLLIAYIDYTNDLTLTKIDPKSREIIYTYLISRFMDSAEREVLDLQKIDEGIFEITTYGYLFRDNILKTIFDEQSIYNYEICN